MRDIAAIVEPAADLRRLARDISREHVALQDIDRKLEANQAQGDSLRARQRQHQLEMGRLLIEAKKQTPHGGWLPFLEKLGISTSSSDRWRDLAKHVEIEFPEYPGSGNLPSHREVVAARRNSGPVVDIDEPSDEQPDPPKSAPKPKLDLVDQEAEQGREMERVYHTVLQKAKAMEPRVRRQFARELRQTADIVEEMQ